jgi:hypothetical protein
MLSRNSFTTALSLPSVSQGMAHPLVDDYVCCSRIHAVPSNQAALWSLDIAHAVFCGLHMNNSGGGESLSQGAEAEEQEQKSRELHSRKTADMEAVSPVSCSMCRQEGQTEKGVGQRTDYLALECTTQRRAIGRARVGSCHWSTLGERVSRRIR